ncbi:hypothetical protein GYM73_03805 [Apibacter sp. ESL0432]|uniref:AHH domain-containing protein n=1 Tax=Apibacter sp. ESL0432 TaxID=2704652 RepID=UPI001C69468A|nr:AHH domain-containing protein [Apibacter sp. ESL0432]QYN48762.1 hypothetical protein GYM73_03805 [Apibacter sp. ESL0432]
MSSNKLKEPLNCPKCGHSLDDDNHKRDIIPPGVFKGNGVDLGNHIIKRTNGKNKFYGGKFENHPFYYPDPTKKKSKKNRNGMEAHHLITTDSLSKNERYQGLVYMLGYNINHRNNGVLLPSIMEVACTFGVPLHKGGHEATFIISREKNPNDKIDEKLIKKEIIPLFPVFNPEDELVKLNYEKHVKDLVNKVCEKYMIKLVCGENEDNKPKVENNFIETSKKFIITMDRFSMFIFRKVRDFKWTITSDGFSYSKGNIGCCGFDRLPKKKEFLKKRLKGVQSFEESSTKKFWGVLYSSEKACNYLEKADFTCTAGTIMKNHYRNPTTYNFYKEKEKIEKFQGFK